MREQGSLRVLEQELAAQGQTFQHAPQGWCMGSGSLHDQGHTCKASESKRRAVENCWQYQSTRTLLLQGGA